MINEISRFKDRYHSFTTDKTYTDLLGKTASGLLKDAAAKTAELSLEQRKQHEYSLNVFSAFCMYFCLTKIRAHYGENIAHSCDEDVVTPLYGRILDRIRTDLETKGESLFVRKLIKRSGVNAVKDIFEKNKKYVPVGPGSEDDFAPVSKSILNILIDGAAAAMYDSERLAALERAIVQAKKQKVLTKDEVSIICHHSGFGNGFKKLSNHEIAQKLGCSDAQATKLRQAACRRLYHFLKETPEFNEIFF